MIRCWIYLEDVLMEIKIRKEKSRMAATFFHLINRFGGENQEVNFRKDKLEYSIPSKHRANSYMCVTSKKKTWPNKKF